MRTYEDLVTAYLSEPGPATLSALRRAVRSAPNFSADLTFDRTVDPLLASGRYAEAVTALRELMPGGLFSPGVHTRLASALRHTGQTQVAARESTLARAAVASIVSTGDGSAERPWSVLRVRDEYDVLSSMKKTPARQELVRDGARYLDHHICADGSDVYFDVTELFDRV
ncbi:DUF4919 domain-containing protein [Nocardioides speluncae]|uniref:DUF4919 domain-containing protein n=1 Tax=Nocardioides speluncae TaxID=2670337 RepID=UPI000D69922A|nr:DUF4919 domain-containing protein [Nocardioides speluncae]